METEVGRVEETEQMGQREERTKGERYISGRTGSKQVHTLRGEGLYTDGWREGWVALWEGREQWRSGLMDLDWNGWLRCRDTEALCCSVIFKHYTLILSCLCIVANMSICGTASTNLHI